MILGKYETKKRLGKGAFGDVVLAQDKSKNQYAIKMISYKSFAGDNAYLLEYLESEIKCLKQMDSPYVMKLYSTEDDQKFKYMICQYCDGGDIISVQSKQPNKVFTLQKASQILSFVIKGLFSLHNAGFVHRDIKAENILMKTENEKQVYKLADFGFTKNIKDISFTILGTGAYMSPEIYNEQEYGFQIDMWAFGVLFYFMLNMQFPFKLNSAPKTKKKSEQLIKLASDFSYKSNIQKSRKKIMQNCTPQIQDLFKKIFDPTPKTRINFHDIRYHPIFQKHFPEDDSLSRILYKTKSMQIKNKTPKLTKDILSMNAKQTQSQIFKGAKILQKPDNIFQKDKEKVEFLKQTLIELSKNADLPSAELLSFKFNIQKSIIMMLKKITKNIEEKQKDRNVESKLKDFFGSDEFKTVKKDLQKQIKKAQFQLDKIYDNCEDNLRSIIKINQYFQHNFEKKTSSIEFEGTFKRSYRKSTVACYQYLVKKIKSNLTKGNLSNYHLTLITMCHAFDKIFNNKPDLNVIFQDYFKSRGPKTDQINFLDLKNFMTQCTATQLNAMTKEIIVKFF